MKPKFELPKSHKQAAAEGWRTLCFAVLPKDYTRGRLILYRGLGRRHPLMGVPFIKRRGEFVFRFDEAKLLRPRELASR